MTAKKVLVQVYVKFDYCLIFFEIYGFYVKFEAAFVEDGHDDADSRIHALFPARPAAR